MKIVTRSLGLAVIIPVIAVCGLQGVRAADDNTPQAAPGNVAPAPSLVPNAGEIKVEGTVQSLDSATGKLVLLVNAVTLPGKDTVNLNPGRQKTVSADNTTILMRKPVSPATSAAPALKLTEIKPDVKVIAIGKDLGVGKEIPARLLQADIAAPAPIAIQPTPGPAAAANPAVPVKPAPLGVPAGPPPTDQEIQRIRDDMVKGNIDDLTALLDQRPSLAIGPYPRNDTPVHQAIFFNKPDIVVLFLKRGASLNVKDNPWGRSPLMTAIFWGKPELAQTLIDQGADINTESNDGKTPLGLAREKNQQDIVGVLEGKNAIEEGPTRGPKAIQWGAPIFAAVQAQNADQVKALLDQDPKLVNARNAQGETPLIADAFWGSLDVEDVLLAHGADVTLKNDGGDTAMKRATFFNKAEFVDALKEHGAKE